MTAEQIKALLAKPARKARVKKGPDSNIRDHATWFALAPKSLIEGKDMRCENPNCIDPRPPKISPLDGSEIKHQHVVEVKGVNICRHCFLSGYLIDDPNQMKI